MRRHPKATFAGSSSGSGMRRGLFGIACLCLLGLAASLGSGAPAAGAAGACPNEALRGGPSAHLPDCRAYELVSPAEKEGQFISGSQDFEYPGYPAGGRYIPLAAVDGEAVAYQSLGTFDDAGPTSNGAQNNFLARRGVSGWSNEQFDPPINNATFGANWTTLLGFTPDLGRAAMLGPERTPLNPEASEEGFVGTANLFFRDNSSRSFQLLSPGLPPELGYGLSHLAFEGLAADGSHVVFQSRYQLTGEPGSNPFLYDWDAEAESLHLIGSGLTTVRHGSQGFVFMNDPWHPVSADGSRVFYEPTGGFLGYASPNVAPIFVRIDGTTTQRVTESELSPGAGEGEFWYANSEGSLAYFVGDSEKLTTDATGTRDLYRYDIDSEDLTDITLDSAEEGANGARVQAVLGAAEDGSRLYFVAQGVLAPGATAGQENLYLWTDDGSAKGEIAFIATGPSSEIFRFNWRYEAPRARVSANGMHLAFNADSSLTGYPNAGFSEIYTYDAGSEELACASCNPSGEPATSGVGISYFDTPTTPAEKDHLSRNVSDSGQVFFNTEEALVPEDVNGKADAYEYDSASGEVALISTGTNGYNSYFFDASADGRDAFLFAQQQLVGADTDELIDLYDARVGGGFAAQNPPPPLACSGEACQNPPPAPGYTTPASASFRGAGNPAPRARHNRCRARHAGKHSSQAQRKQAKQRCRGAKRRAGK